MKNKKKDTKKEIRDYHPTKKNLNKHHTIK